MRVFTSRVSAMPLVARVRVARDHRGLVHAARVHDADPLGPLGRERRALGRRVLVARVRHERPHVADVVVAVEDVEVVNGSSCPDS